MTERGKLRRNIKVLERRLEHLAQRLVERPDCNYDRAERRALVVAIFYMQKELDKMPLHEEER